MKNIYYLELWQKWLRQRSRAIGMLRTCDVEQPPLRNFLSSTLLWYFYLLCFPIYLLINWKEISIRYAWCVLLFIFLISMQPVHEFSNYFTQSKCCVSCGSECNFKKNFHQNIKLYHGFIYLSLYIYISNFNIDTQYQIKYQTFDTFI